MTRLLLIIFTLICLPACASTKIDVSPVTPFASDAYLGTWYEIARLDHVFERGLEDVTANYTVREKGGITVLNRGYNTKKARFKTATGRAKFPKGEDVGQLKVSFFGPFFGDYIIFDMDADARSHAFVSGGRDDYLWLLSRTPDVTAEVKADFISQAKALGYETDALIWVPHSRAKP